MNNAKIKELIEKSKTCQPKDRHLSELFGEYESATRKNEGISPQTKEILLYFPDYLCNYGSNPAGTDEVKDFLEIFPKMLKEGKIAEIKHNLKVLFTHYRDSPKNVQAEQTDDESLEFPGKIDAEKALSKLEKLCPNDRCFL